MHAEARLLGSGIVHTRDGQVIAPHAWRTAKTFDLFRVLALAGGPLPIDTLLELFWPNAELLRGKASLRTAACQIRKVLGPDSIVRTTTALMLQDITVDVVQYRRLVALVDDAQVSHPAKVLALVDEAEAIYRGDLDVNGSDCVSLHDTADQLRSKRAHLLLEAARAAGRVGDWRLSLQYAERAATIETSDHCTRALMRAWFALGETGKPIEAFEHLRRHLSTEYGVDPAPQTRALYLQVVGSCEEWPPRSRTVGREQQVREVVIAVTKRLLDAERPAGVVWVVGEPGSGRDTVAREAARTMVLPLLEGSRDAHGTATLELLPDQGPVNAGLAATLRGRASARGRILLIPVTRLPGRARNGGDAVVRVPPLPRAEFRRLLALALQGPPTPRLEATIYESSGGLPGLACENARYWLQSDDLTWTSDGVDSRRRTPVAARLRVAMAVLPIACLDLLGTLGGEGLERHDRPVVHPSVAVGCPRDASEAQRSRNENCMTLSFSGRSARMALA